MQEKDDPMGEAYTMPLPDPVRKHNIFRLLTLREINGSLKVAKRDTWNCVNSNSGAIAPASLPLSAKDAIPLWAEEDSLKHCSAFYCPLQPAPRSTIAAAFSLDGTTLASTHGDHTVKIICSTTGKCLKTLTGHRRTPWVVRFHPQEPNILASGSLDHEVRLWDANIADCIAAHDFYRPIASLAFHASGEILAVASGHKLFIWKYKENTTDSAPTIVLRTKRSLRAVHFHPHGADLLLTAEVNDLDFTECPPTVALSSGYNYNPPPTIHFSPSRNIISDSSPAPNLPTNDSPNPFLSTPDPFDSQTIPRTVPFALADQPPYQHPPVFMLASWIWPNLSNSSGSRPSMLSEPNDNATNGNVQNSNRPETSPGFNPFLPFRNFRAATPEGVRSDSLSVARPPQRMYSYPLGGTGSQSSSIGDSAPVLDSQETSTSGLVPHSTSGENISEKNNEDVASMGPETTRGMSAVTSGMPPLDSSFSLGVSDRAASDGVMAEPAQLSRSNPLGVSSRPPTVQNPYTNPSQNQSRPSPSFPYPLSTRLPPPTERNDTASMDIDPSRSSTSQPSATTSLFSFSEPVQRNTTGRLERDTGMMMDYSDETNETSFRSPRQDFSFRPYGERQQESNGVFQILNEPMNRPPTGFGLESLNAPGSGLDPAASNVPTASGSLFSTLPPSPTPVPLSPIPSPNLASSTAGVRGNIPESLRASMEMHASRAQQNPYLPQQNRDSAPSEYPGWEVPFLQGWMQGQAQVGSSGTPTPDVPCTVKLRIWPHSMSKPSGVLDSDTCKLVIPHAVLCSEMGAHFSPCGKYLAACVACIASTPPTENDSSFLPNAVRSPVLVRTNQPGASPTQHPLGIVKSMVYELRIYSLEAKNFGQVLASRAVRAAHCLTSIQFSPSSSFLLLAYGRRHHSLLKSLVSDGTSIIPVYTVLEIYRVSDMSLVRVLPSAEDEVNVACFHPKIGGGLIYGTKEGKLRILRHDKRSNERINSQESNEQEDR